MSKCIKTIPLSEIERLAVVQGQGRTLGQIKAALKPDLIMNGGFYDTNTGKPIYHLKVNGTVLAKNSETRWGYCWAGADVAMRQVPNEEQNYISGVELLTPWDGMTVPLRYGREVGGKRGRTAMAHTGENPPAAGGPPPFDKGGSLILYCSGDGTKDAKTPEGLREELHGLGATTALMLDGGGSSQCDFGGGQVIVSGRRVHNYICVWLKPKKLYRVQVGAYEVKANAERLRDELKAKGYPGFIQEVDT